MRRIWKAVPVILLLASVSAAVFSQNDFGAGAARMNQNPDLRDMMTYAIQDEYLARAEYEAIIDRHGPVRPFSKIIKSEETHIGLLVPLFESYGFDVPEDRAGEYVHVPDNLKTALEIGVEAEINNIAMYESFLAADIPDDVRSVFERLKSASENHLNAFENGLKRYQ